MRNPILAVALVAGMGYGVFNTLGHMPSDKPVAIPDAAPGASPTAPRPIKQDVVAYHTGDKAMQAAKQNGRATLPRFHQLIAAGTPRHRSITCVRSKEFEMAALCHLLFRFL